MLNYRVQSHCSHLMSQVQAKYPDMITRFQVSSKKEPNIQTTSDKMTLTAYGDVEAYVIDKNDTQDYLFTLGVVRLVMPIL